MNQNDSEQLPQNQQQRLGDVQIQGNDNIFNTIQGQNVTLTQTKIIQISADEIKTRELIVASPYKGLKTFEPEDANRFFGRDQFLAGLINELEQTNFLLLLGASGSGKSSVVRAGLIPWLREKWGNRFVSLMLTPDRDPFESLYGSLLSRGYSQSQAQMAKAGKVETLSQVVKTLKPSDAFWLIFIDQFEELFTVSEDDKRDRFIESLIKLSQTSLPSVRIVATMQADFLNRLSPYPRLVKATDRHRPLIAEMQVDELRLAIEQPAAYHGVVFETGLVEEITTAVQGQAGYLPLLQYTLDLLWESEVQDGGINDRTLNITSYRRLNGVRGALQQRVDQIYAALSKSEQLAAQRIFLKLVGIGGDAKSGIDWKPVRRRAARSEFTSEQEQTVLTQLIDQNLVVSDAIVQAAKTAPVSTVEIVHEILLTSWSQLRDWIQKNRQSIALRNRLNDDVAIWQLKKADSDLWSGSKLAQALELRRDPVFQQVLGGFTSVADDFINASVGLRDRQRRRAILGLSGFSLVALTLAAFAGYQWREADLGQIQALSQSSVAKFTLNRNVLDGLIDALKAGKLFERSPWMLYRDPQLQAKIMTALTQTVYWTQEQNRLKGHDKGVTSLSFSRDSQTIASSSHDGTIILWHRDGSQIATLKGHTDIVNSVRFNPVDGQTLVSGSLDKTVRLWRRDGTLLKTLDGHGIIMSVCFSPNGQLIAASGGDNTVRLWQLDGKPLAVLTGHKGRINSISFSRDGQTIASASSDRTVKLWQRNGSSIKTLKGHQSEVFNVSFSPDGQMIASTGADDTVKLWQKDGTLATTFKANSGEVNAISFNSNGKILASAGHDSTVKLWNRKGELLTTLTGHTNWVTDVAFSPDGKLLGSTSNDGSVKLWQRQNPLLNVLSNGSDEVNSVSLSPDGQLLVAASKDNTVKLWRRDGSLISILGGHQGRINKVGFSHDGQIFASASEDGRVNLRRRDGKLLSSLKGPYKFSDMSFDPSGKMIATADLTGGVQLWQRDGKQLKTWQAHDGSAYSVNFSSNGQILASAGLDGSVRLWKLDGTPIITLKEPKKKVSTIYRISLSPDNLIAAASVDGTVKLWTIDGTLVKSFSGKNSPMIAVSFSPNGQMVASADEMGTIFLWQVDGTLITELNGHSKPVMDLSFASNGKTLASASDDTNVIVWNLDSLNVKYWLDLGCSKVRNFLMTNPSLDESTRQLCTNTSTRR